MPTLREAIDNTAYFEQAATGRSPEVSEAQLSSLKISEMVFKMADVKGRPFLYMDAEDWEQKWLASKNFKLMRVPVHAVACPCAPEDRNWVLTTMAARRVPGTERPVVIDVNKRRVGRSPSGYIPPVVVLDGKHRWMGASMRGEETVLAWIGEDALKHLPQPRALNLAAAGRSLSRFDSTLELFGASRSVDQQAAISKHSANRISRPHSPHGSHGHKIPHQKRHHFPNESFHFDAEGVSEILSGQTKMDAQQIEKLLADFSHNEPGVVYAKSPPGWEKTVEALKKHFKDPATAFKLAWYMKKHGAQSHIHNDDQLKEAEKQQGRWKK